MSKSSVAKRSKGQTLNLSIRFSLLCSALAVALAASAALILNMSTFDPFSLLSIFVTSIIVVVLLLTLLYAGYELFMGVNIALQDQNMAHSVCISALIGSFVLGFVATLIATVTGQDIIISTTTIIISVVSLGCLPFFLIFDATHTKRAMGKGSLAQPLALPGPFDETEAHTYNETQHNGPIIDRRTLPPLFQNDPLYQMSQPRPPARLLYVVKEGEDACTISPDERRFALSDGAGGSSLPRPWAALLGKKWIKEPPADDYIKSLPAWLEEPRQRWEHWVRATWFPAVNERNQLTGDYLVQPQELAHILEQGAYATLLGLEINHQSRAWRALAIGDTCLFIVQRSAQQPVLNSLLPMNHSAEFNLAPPLLSSNRHNDTNTLQLKVKHLSGFYQASDTFLMATDALSQWLLLQKEQGLEEWQALLTITDQQSFARFVERQRQDGLMEEDDTTLIVIPLS